MIDRNYRKYESIYVTKPDLTEAEEKRIFERVIKLIENKGGRLIRLDDWGVRKTAYPIRKYTKAHYLQLTYIGPPGIVGDLEKIFRMLDGIIRFYTMKTADEVPTEALSRDYVIYTSIDGTEKKIPYEKVSTLKLKADAEIKIPEPKPAPAVSEAEEEKEEEKTEQKIEVKEENTAETTQVQEGGEQ